MAGGQTAPRWYVTQGLVLGSKGDGGALLYVDKLDGNRYAQTTWTREGPVIRFSHKLSSHKRSSTLAHELHHLARGGVCKTFCPKNEAKVRRATARWLLPDIELLGSALRKQAIGPAATLGVDSGLIWDRLDFATDREHALLDDMLGDRRHLLITARAAQPELAVAH